MKSAQLKGYRRCEVIVINRNTSVPNNPTAGKIVVNVRAAGVNPSDWKIREGYFQQMSQLQFRSPSGMDFSGVVEKVGRVSGLSRGDEVYA